MRTKDEVIGAWKHISENDKQWWIGTSIDLMKIEGMQELGTESIKLLQSQPEVIRCKDCKHCYVDGENVRFNVCDLDHNKVQSDDWFCADGERKEQTDDSEKEQD